MYSYDHIILVHKSLREMKMYIKKKKNCTKIFIVILFRIAPNWKELKCPSE